MRAIETEYNGYLFRSRLEARWAVFFDALGIAYQYEPEGFELDNGEWYLPDFWLPEMDTWVECKGPKTHGKHWRLGDKMLAGTGKPFILVDGLDSYPVWRKPLAGWLLISENHRGYFCWFGKCGRCGAVHWFTLTDRDCRKCGATSLHVTPAIEEALVQAKQARFEHGQVGAPSDWEATDA